MTTHTPQQASDFEYIYNPDGTCHFWYCGKPGKLLVYDDFSPEGGLWFCESCWNDFQGDDCNWLTIVEDKRLEQAILEATEKNSDDLMDLLQKAIETMDEAQAEHLMDKVHQIQSENLRDIRGWRE